MRPRHLSIASVRTTVARRGWLELLANRDTRSLTVPMKESGSEGGLRTQIISKKTKTR